MAYDEDLDYNPFFRALQKEFSGMYDRAQKNAWLVCVPVTASLRGVALNQNFAEMHILKPSPYFQDQYLPAYKYDWLTFSIEGGIIRSESGFEKTFQAEILCEELAYSKDFKQFRILVISRPLDSNYQPPASEALSEIGIPLGKLMQERVDVSEHTRLLKSLPHYDQLLISLDKAIVQFNNNYMIVEGFLKHAANKLETICREGLETIYRLVRSMRKVAAEDSRVVESLRLSIESYVLSFTHQKVLHSIQKDCQEDDKLIHSRCVRYTGMTAEMLGVQEEFACKMPEAMVELCALDSFCTPLEKLHCLRRTLNGITDAVHKHLTEGVLGVDVQPPTLVSDDLIPMVVAVIIQAKCNRLATNLYYIENFNWTSSAKANLGYTLVTFKAAMEYILSTDLGHLVPSEVEQDATSSNPAAAGVAAMSHGRVLTSIRQPRDLAISRPLRSPMDMRIQGGHAAASPQQHASPVQQPSSMQRRGKSLKQSRWTSENQVSISDHLTAVGHLPRTRQFVRGSSLMNDRVRTTPSARSVTPVRPVPDTIPLRRTASEQGELLSSARWMDGTTGKL